MEERKWDKRKCLGVGGSGICGAAILIWVAKTRLINSGEI